MSIMSIADAVTSTTDGARLLQTAGRMKAGA